MNQNCKRSLSLARGRVLSLLLPLFLPAFCHGNTIVWTNTAGGSWSTPVNWNPNQAPAATDTAYITNSGTYTVTISAATTVGALVVGSQGSGTQTLQGSGYSLTSGNITVGANGVLSLTSSTLYGPLTIGSGGLVTGNGLTMNSQVTVQSGGQLYAFGSIYVGQNGLVSDATNWVLVQNGGLVSSTASAQFGLYVTATNAGVMDITNNGVFIYNNGTSTLDGGLINQAAGVINLIGGPNITGSQGSDYLVNQGTINVTNGVSVISVDNLTNSGTVATLSGSGTSLRIGTYNGPGSLDGTYNAAAGSVIQFAGGGNPGTSAGTPLVLGGAGQYQFYSGQLTLTTNVIPGLILAGGNVVLGAGFQSGAITNLVLDGSTLTNSLPITGSLIATNSTISGTLSVQNGATLAINAATLNAQITVQSGGQLTAYAGECNFGQGGNSNDTNNWLWVQNGGFISASSTAQLFVYVAITNAGLVNTTYYGFYVYNNGAAGDQGGIINQPSGVINLVSTAYLQGYDGYDYLVNQGTINVTNGSSEISVDNLTNSGTVATLPSTGSLQIGKFNGPGTLTGTYNAAAGTIIYFNASTSPGTSPGSPLSLLGGGQFVFYSGQLTLNAGIIPGLALVGGDILLGPGFEGGAITNLALDGAVLTNNLPVTGTFAATNGSVWGTLTLSNGATMIVDNTYLDAQVTVKSGGEILAVGGCFFGSGSQPGNATNWLWVQSGGYVSAASSAAIDFYEAATNAGVMSATNEGFYVYNNGTADQEGGMLNQAGGVINLVSTAYFYGYNGEDYLYNQGTINATNGNSEIIVDNLVNSGTINAQTGAGTLEVGIFNGLGTLSGTYNAAAGSVIYFEGSANPGTSAGSPLILGGAGQYEFYSGQLTLTTNVIPGLALAGGDVLLGPGFQGGAITNLVLNGSSLTNSLPITGAFVMTNGTLMTSTTLSNNTVTLDNVTMYGVLTIESNAEVSANNTALNAQVTVENGGELLALGGCDLGEAGHTTDTNNWLWVQTGGYVSASSGGPFYIYVAATNAGVMNATNYGIYIYNNGTGNYDGGLLNQTGGVINLIGTSGLLGYQGNDYLINDGTINATNGGSVVSMDSLTNSGTMVALPGTGTLRIGSFNGLGSLTGTYNAAAGTVVQFVAGASPGTSAGTPLVLGGAGQYQFYGGQLTLPTNVIPGVILAGGNIVLGPSFQGGAITNLALNGSALTNSLPVSGNLVDTNSTIFGKLTIQTGSTLTVNSAILNAAVTIQNGGKLLAGGQCSFGQNSVAGDATNWLWVQSGGYISGSYAPLYLFTAATNAGLITTTNNGLYIYNNNGINYDGSLLNQAGGVINLNSGAGINGYGNYDYLVNQGAINGVNPNSSSSIAMDAFTNYGALNALSGAINLTGGSNLQLEPSGTLNVLLTTPTKYTDFSVSGQATLAGTFAASLAGGYLPTTNTTFNVMTYGSRTGTFSGPAPSAQAAKSLPGVQKTVLWGLNYGSTVMSLVATQVTSQFVFSGSGGTSGKSYVILSTTNLALPLADWTPVVTNTFGASGSFVFTNSINPAYPQEFFTY